MSSRQRATQDSDPDDAQQVLDSVTEASTEAVEQLSNAAGAAEDAFRRANSSLQRSSDQTLALMGAFSVGAALGLVAAGSSRLIIGLALVPAALVAGVVLERRDQVSRPTRPTLN